MKLMANIIARVSLSSKDKLEKLALKNGVSISWLLRSIIDEYLARHSKS
jgi:hypothetical protein